jgi:serine/threonine protein kinase
MDLSYMSLSQNSQLLVEKLEKMPLLDDRFENIRLVNFDSVSDQRRGCFSLVFSAFDRAGNKTVALKFFDINPVLMVNQYRLNAFNREHEILQTLSSRERCLQLESALSIFNLSVDTPGGQFTLPCQYFAVEWIDEDIDKYFLLNDQYDPILKLKLFNEIVLAIEALHRYEVFHRDIKSDNLRSYQNALARIVVAIDLGTAARISSGYIQSDYIGSVGAPAYAAPEALCGLAGHRLLAPYTDQYALGCLLFELFNKDYYFRAVRARNPHYDFFLSAMGGYVNGEKDEENQLIKWKSAIRKHAAGFSQVVIDGEGSDVHRGIASLINYTANGLTNVDFSKRPKLELVRKQVWTAIRILENEKMCQHKVRLSKEMRRKRKEKLIQREIRLRKYLELRKLPC